MIDMLQNKIINDLKRFWKQLDEEYFQDVDIDKATQTIEEMI